jgi:hypothetical protein
MAGERHGMCESALPLSLGRTAVAVCGLTSCRLIERALFQQYHLSCSYPYNVIGRRHSVQPIEPPPPPPCVCKCEHQMSTNLISSSTLNCVVLPYSATTASVSLSYATRRSITVDFLLRFEYYGMSRGAHWKCLPTFRKNVCHHRLYREA